MAALDNFRINDPNFQNTADELANRAYEEARNRGLSHLDALHAIEDGPMGLNRNLLSETGSLSGMHGYISKYIRDLKHRDDSYDHMLPPPAEAAPALTPSHLTGPKMGSAPQPALQTGAPAEPRPPHVNPKAHMQSAIANDPLLQLMAGGNKRRVGPQETLYFYNSLDPAVQQQHASRIDGSHLAKLEMRDAMGPPPMYGNLDGTVYGTGAGAQVESGDPVDALQEREIARLQEVERMKRINNPLGGTGGALTGTSGEPPVLAAGPDRLGSNRLTNFLSGLTYDALGYFTGTSADDVIANGINVTYNGNEIFATDGENTVPIDAKTAEAIEAANNSSTEQDPTAITGPFMGGYGQESLPPAVPALTTPDESDTGNTDNTVPALTQPTQSTVRSTTGGYTGNARGSDLPDMQIGLNERLMRMGAAGLAAGGQGSLAQMGAMFGASADVNQANRQAEMEAFGIEEERRQAHAARVAALAASKNKGADAETGAAASSARIALDNANDVLQGFDDFDGVTGPFNWFVSGWDSSGFGDAGRANVRLKISKMKVDSTLARVAETKGAISEKEMEIFESDQPSFYASEDVWREWVTNYIRALKIMNTNLSTGQTPYKNGGGGGSTGKEVLFTAPNGGKVFAE